MLRTEADVAHPRVPAPVFDSNSADIAEPFDSVLRNYRKLVWAEANRLTQTKHLQDDLFQEGCWGLWDALGLFCPGGEASFTTFATTCIRNRMYKLLRREYRHSRNLMLEDYAAETNPGGTDRFIDDREDEGHRIRKMDVGGFRVLIQRHLAELPERQHLAVRVHFLEGKSRAEVAEQLGVSRARVTQLIRSAISTLAAMPELQLARL